jgi:hypothetical protein
MKAEVKGDDEYDSQEDRPNADSYDDDYRNTGLSNGDGRRPGTRGYHKVK